MQISPLNHYTAIDQSDIDFHNETHKRFGDTVPIRKAVEIRRKEIITLSKQPDRVWISSIMFSNFLFLYAIQEATT